MFRQENSFYEFGPFRLDLREKALRRDGVSVALTPKAFDTLLILIEKSGRLVEKEELMKQLWPDSFVEENSLSQNIYLLRKALGETSHGPRYIETVPKRGYRFIAGVQEGSTRPGELETDGATVEIDTGAVEREAWPGADAPQDASKTEISAPALSQNAFVLNVRQPSRWSRHFIVFLLLPALTLIAGWFLWGMASRTTARADVKTIAVLPFTPLGAQSNEDHLGLGVTDAMIAKFSNLQQITVRPTSAVLKYAGRSYDPSAVGGELRVDAVLEGTVQRAGDRVRVTVQLIRVRDAQPLWAERFDEKFTNVFAVQDAISEQVAQALRLRLTADERKQLAKRYTDNSEAYQAYVRGGYFWGKRTEDALTKSVEYYKQAIQLDSHYALAWAGLADSYAVIAFLGYHVIPEREAYQKAQDAAMKALELDPTIAEPHTALSVVRAYRDYDLRGAEVEAKKAIALRDNYPTAHQRYSIYLRDQGRLDEALREIRRAQQLDPLSATIGSNLAYNLYLQRDYDQAAERCRQVLETEQDFFQPLLILGMIYDLQQKPQESIAILKRAKELNQGKGSVYYNALEILGHAYAMTGRKAEAERIIAEFRTFPEDNGDTTYYEGLILAGLGEIDKSFAMLEKSSTAWTLPPVTLMLDPRYARLRADARYDALIKKKFGRLNPIS
jgi:TolB-like protein/DNA-binding winged helix-turn-helix (wHTH) protein/Flp pilus assembly protein TadD